MSAQNAVPLLDLKAQFATIKDEVMPAVEQVFTEQAFILGSHVQKVEEELAAYLDSPYALGVSSGTDALLLSLMALGVGPGDAVITTPFTFFATAGSIVRTGAMPLFVDIDPLTYNLDHTKVAALLNLEGLPAKPKAMVPVHLFGQPAHMDALMALAQGHDIAVVEDAAQALGAVYPSKDGPKMAGTIGDAGCFSFFPSKNLGAAGDGGLIASHDQELAERLRSMRTHGSHPKEKYRHVYLGGNFRLDAVQAAVISAKLPHLDDWALARRANASEYDARLTDAGLVENQKVMLPHRAWPQEERSHVFNQYVIRAKNRSGLIAHLKERGIGHAVYYPAPIHLLECFASMGYKPGNYPVAEQACDEVLALPVYPELTSGQKEQVVKAIVEFYT